MHTEFPRACFYSWSSISVGSLRAEGWDGVTKVFAAKQ